MSARQWAGTAVSVLVLVLVVSLVVGHLLGQPILIGYVTSDSMEPTIDEGDGFVAIPSVLTGDVEAGDVVVFHARELHDGGLTTHRVVEVREGGYVTKGDGNPFTDQDGPEPLVTDGQVVAEALQVGGHVVTIPYLGTLIGGIGGVADGIRGVAAGALGLGFLTSPRGFGFLLMAVGLALVGLAARGGGRGARRIHRDTSRRHVVKVWSAVGGVALVVVLLATAAMVVPGGTQEFGAASALDPGGDPLEVEPGGSTEVDYEVRNAGLVPTVAVLEPASEGVAVEPRVVTVGGRSSTTATATITVPEEAGVHYRQVEEHRYLLVLPTGVLAALHSVHPLLALLAVDLVVGGLVVLAGVAALGTDDLRLRPHGSDLPAGVRVRRLVSRWF